MKKTIIWILLLTISFILGFISSKEHFKSKHQDELSKLNSLLRRVYEIEDLWSSVALGAVRTYGKLSKNQWGYNQRKIRVKVSDGVHIPEYGGTLNSDSSFGIKKVSNNEYEIYISGRIE